MPSRPEVKVLYVHGIGTHAPGHGTALRQNLATSLGLEIRAPRAKRIVIANRDFPDRDLGEINITRLTDAERRRDLLFYELTWSPITQPDKELLAFDKEQDYVLRRAAVNQAMRTFVNDIAPDPLAYAGREARADPGLGRPVGICWMTSRSWGELPELTENTRAMPICPASAAGSTWTTSSIITHSLGSRATLDAMQSPDQSAGHRGPELRQIADEFSRIARSRSSCSSNQLPLLEAGREGQQVIGPDRRLLRAKRHERPGRFFARDADHRLLRPQRPDELPGAGPVRRTLHRIALVPERHQRHHQCRPVNSFLGLGEVANPLGAHTGYGADERVGALIAQGAGNPNVAPLVAERCTWRETDESLMR